jgi:Rps23 Pro-64 3,4-dihydroxylase Tpa1-like proline 4-hydroxylase
MGLLREFSDSEFVEMRKTFAAAEPFPHIVIDDFLNEQARDRLSDFPSKAWPYWNTTTEGFQKAKHYCNDITKIPSACGALIRECNEPAFLSAVEHITGIDQIIADPYLEGGGLHASSEGGVLVPHTDFHYYERLHMFRMVNLIVYLNEEWGANDGGNLELYKRGDSTPTVSVVPRFGRAVIFKTDDQSIHGFSTPVGPGKWRKSVAIYYYNSREAAGFSGDTTTYWQAHGTRLKGLRLAAFQGLSFTARMVAKLAHRIDPNL